MRRVRDIGAALSAAEIALLSAIAVFCLFAAGCHISATACGGARDEFMATRQA